MEENNIKKEKKSLLKEFRQIIDEVDRHGSLNKENLDKFKDQIEKIRKEVDDTGEDVDDIKEDLQEIKTSHQRLVDRMKGAIAEKFGLDDFAQQIVGATIVSAPFAVTEEVWRLAGNLHFVNLLIIIAMTIIFDVILFYYTKYQKIKQERIGIFPLRILSLLAVTYVTATIILTVFGVIGGQVTTGLWAVKLVIFVGFFANIGAGTADLIR